MFVDGCCSESLEHVSGYEGTSKIELSFIENSVAKEGIIIYDEKHHTNCTNLWTSTNALELGNQTMKNE